MDVTYEKEMLEEITLLTKEAYASVKALDNALNKAARITEITELGCFYKEKVLKEMEKLRTRADRLEEIVASEHWCFPTYGDLLFFGV